MADSGPDLLQLSGMSTAFQNANPTPSAGLNGHFTNSRMDTSHSRRPTTVNSGIIVPQNAINSEALTARLISRAPMQAQGRQSLTMGFRRVTKAQRVTRDRQRGIQLEPLPALAMFQSHNQPSYIQEQNKLSLLNQGWEPPQTSSSVVVDGRDATASRKRSIDGGPSTSRAGVPQYKVQLPKPVLSPIPPKQAKSRPVSRSYPSRQGKRRFRSIEDVVAANINDPIEIISLVRENKKLGFLYMTPRADRSSNDYSPYNLKIVTHDNIKPDDYMTISNEGVTRICDGDTEFTELDRWEQEYK